MNMLELCYYHGEGVKQDRKEAVEYYQKAVELENSEAMINLGNCYSYGKGVKKIIQKQNNYIWKHLSLEIKML